MLLKNNHEKKQQLFNQLFQVVMPYSSEAWIYLHTLIIAETKAIKTDFINVRHEKIYHQIGTRKSNFLNI